MSVNLQEKLQYHDIEKYKQDNGEFYDLMRPSFVASMDIAIDDFRKRMDALARQYKEYYQNGQKMLSQQWQKDFGRDAHTLKGQANLNYINKMFEPMAKLQKAIDSDNKSDLDKYMYEVFAFRKKYLECLYAIKDEDLDEPEFDLRQFDEFTKLNLAQLYQSVPINSKSITFNQIGSASIINKIDHISADKNNNNQQNKQGGQEKIKTLISETINESVEIIPSSQGQQQENKKNNIEGDKENGVEQETKTHESPDSLYSYTKKQREKGPQISPEDLPIDSSQFICSIF